MRRPLRAESGQTKRPRARTPGASGAMVFGLLRLDFVGLRYMNVYGPRQDYHGAYIAVIMKMLDESGELGETAGQRAVSILLLEDLAGLRCARHFFDVAAAHHRVELVGSLFQNQNPDCRKLARRLAGRHSISIQFARGYVMFLFFL